MNSNENEREYRKELQYQIDHWKNRAQTAEKFLRMLMNEFPEANAMVLDRAKCDIDNSDVRCRGCNCWKSKQKEKPTNDP